MILSSVADIIAQRKADRGSTPVDLNKSPKRPSVADNLAGAMEEMMRRIRSGAPMVRTSSQFPKIGKKENGSSSTDSDSDAADEQEFQKFCSRVGSSRRKGVLEKSTTLPASMTSRKEETNLNIWKLGLKPAKQRLQSDSGSSNVNGNGSIELRKVRKFPLFD